MPGISPSVYTFASIYLGDAAPASGQLINVPNIRTQGVRITDSTPSVFFPWLSLSAMSDLREVRVETQYYDTSTVNIVELASKGISLSGDISDPSDLQMYSLLLVSPNENSRESFYFPNVRTEINYSASYTKDNGIVVPVSFFIQTEDLVKEPYSKDTIANLIVEMGSRSPL